MANINTRKRNNGSWEYYFETAGISGKRKRCSKGGFSTKKLALEAGTKALAEYNSSGLTFTPTEMSVADYLDYWVDKYCIVNLKSTTVSNYRKKIKNHIKPALGKYRLDSVNPAVLQDFINTLFNNGFSRNTLSVIKGILSSSFGYAVEPLKFIKFSPMTYVKTPNYRAVPKTPTRTAPHICLTREQMKAIFIRFKEGSSVHLPIQLGYRCGLRHGEAFAVKWSDIDFFAKTLTVNHQLQHNDERNQWYLTLPKYESVRTIELDDTLLELLKRTKALQEENRENYDDYYTDIYADKDGFLNTDGNGTLVDFINVYENGGFIQPRVTMHANTVIHNELGIKDYDFHSLRHTHCTYLIENGANPKYVQIRLGHKNIEMTLQVYNHVTERMKDDGFDVINKVF